ncbi:MAG: hypothetical protein ACK4RZ_17070, partial [Paracoccaceae bacterium]
MERGSALKDWRYTRPVLRPSPVPDTRVAVRSTATMEWPEFHATPLGMSVKSLPLSAFALVALSPLVLIGAGVWAGG